MEELVGRRVERKSFKGRCPYTGVVHSYDRSSGLFKIVYEDGDSEELGFSEVAALVSDPVDPPAGGDEVSVLDLNLDPNAGFDLNLKEIDPNGNGTVEGEGGGLGSEMERIDLNFDMNGVVEGNEVAGTGSGEIRKRECDFDLNLEVNGEVITGEDVGGGEGVLGNWGLVEVLVHDGSNDGFGLASKDGLGAAHLMVEVMGDGNHGIGVEHRGRGRPRGRRKLVEDLVFFP